MKKKEPTETDKLNELLQEKTALVDTLSGKLKRREEELQKEIDDHAQTRVRHLAIYRAVSEERDCYKEKLRKIMSLIQTRLQPAGSPPPGDEVCLTEWITSSIQANQSQE